MKQVKLSKPWQQAVDWVFDQLWDFPLCRGETTGIANKQQNPWGKMKLLEQQKMYSEM